jgi:hypothetical protein
LVTKLIDDGNVFDNSMERMLIHGIAATNVMAELGALNKLNADWDNLTNLMTVGHERADACSRRISVSSKRNQSSITWREGAADWLSSRFARQRVRPAFRSPDPDEDKSKYHILRLPAWINTRCPIL